ncbi:MAG: hypothetical protein IPM79_36965 [Polyangiaceae bacterium]|nr:hypothetical protein [Polyangiaceae bacterium]MBK8943047.1 hypothetical protein [Polyangiaceae bacterium]
MAYDDDLEKRQPSPPEPVDEEDRAAILARRAKLVVAAVSTLAIAGGMTPACEPNVCLSVEAGGYGGYGGYGGQGGQGGDGGQGAGFGGDGGQGGDGGAGGQGGQGGQGGSGGTGGG